MPTLQAFCPPLSSLFDLPKGPKIKKGWQKSASDENISAIQNEYALMNKNPGHASEEDPTIQRSNIRYYIDEELND